MSSPVEHQYNAVDRNKVHPPRLPSGQVIDAKNTLQSFISPVEAMEAGVTPTVYAEAISEAAVSPVMVVHDAKAAPTENDVLNAPPDPTVNTTTDTVNITTDTYIPAGSNEPLPPLVSQPYKSRNTVWILVAIVAVAVAIGLGISLAMKGQNDSPQTSPNPAVAPTPNESSTEKSNRTISDVYEAFINGIKLSSVDIAVGGTSPESLALEWMIVNSDASWDLSELDPSLEDNALSFRVKQRFPLLTMWFQQGDTITWATKNGWLKEADECLWYGISCQTRDLGGMVGSQDVITGISLVGEGAYVGSLPADVGLLSHLEHFEIVSTYDPHTYKRDLHGTLPDTIGKWTALTYLNIGHNELSGSLPYSIGEWSLLNHFDISYNEQMYGSLPDSIDKWTLLTDFYISDSTLSGSLSEVAKKWSVLRHFDAGDNSLQLTGLVPDAIGQWTSLTYFNVSDNNSWYAQQLPESIGQWTALKVFDVSGNYLSGSIPSSIGNWSLIEQANFYSNSFSGTMPDAICKYIQVGDALQADCNKTVDRLICSCCTNCYA